MLNGAPNIAPVTLNNSTLNEGGIITTIPQIPDANTITKTLELL
jgi:hypothetical protein